MPFRFHLIPIRLLLTAIICLTAGTFYASIISARTAKGADSETPPGFQWNINDKELPLLALEGDRLKPGFDRALTYPMDQFRFLIFQSLTRDDEHGRYQLPALSGASPDVHFIEFESIGDGKTYLSLDGSGIELIDQNTLKIVRTVEGVKFLFIQYPDAEFRCASIKNARGARLDFLYAANGLTLHGVVDSFGRTIRFNYESSGIASITQNWMANNTGITKSWPIGEAPENDTVVEPVRYSHAVPAKVMPRNALIREYTTEMAASDVALARIFGESTAVVAANGFEPIGLAGSYPLYRGDIIGDDGRPRRGHLSWALHIYGSSDGTGDSRLYVPAGFTSHSGGPSPTDAVVTFYYPRLGNLTDVTLAVFHVANFQITFEGERVRIGNLGGPGGASPIYKHTHIEFYKGNTALPPAGARARLRIDPSTVFTK
ncbi:MAG TPA: hypothetical protein VJT71_01410 [Pyrinomonadaceae bacterium]|nr:hypothetical protein [Pyrinomonadaceae bacterium]